MAPRKALVIANPASNHGQAAELVPVAAGLLENLFPHEIVVTDAPSHAKMLAADASGFDVLIAMGGDGTVHEILNGLMLHPAETRPALAVIPTGSGNDYRRTLGMASDLYGTINKAFGRLTDAQRLKIRQELGISTIKTVATYNVLAANDALDAIEAKLAEAT